MDVTKWSDKPHCWATEREGREKVKKTLKVIYTSFKDKDFATTCLRICTYAILFWVSILLLTKSLGNFWKFPVIFTCKFSVEIFINLSTWANDTPRWTENCYSDARKGQNTVNRTQTCSDQCGWLKLNRRHVTWSMHMPWDMFTIQHFPWNCSRIPGIALRMVGWSMKWSPGDTKVTLYFIPSVVSF